jgi:small subunit ribosomal protein S19
MAREKRIKHVKVKEALYRGQKIEDLKTLDVRESAKYLPSRSRRSVMRHFDQIEKFVKKCEIKSSKNKRIRTHLRDLVIVPQLVGKKIGVHTGREFQEVELTHEMIGHRLGEFAPTRTRVSHGSAGIGATKSSRAQKK